MIQRDQRVITSEFKQEDIEQEFSLRPHSFEEYVGQEKVKKLISMYVTAAKGRGEALDHVLLYGPPGLGKTTLANIIASEMGVSIRVTSGPAIERPGDLAAILTNLAENDVLFIDEIHRLNRSVEEVLYPAMEDYVLDIMVGKGPSARSIRLNLPHFTLIGATTRAGMLTSPLRDRFGVICRLDMYTPEQLNRIVTRSATILGVETRSEGCMALARRSRGTPRIANRLLKRVRDYAQVHADGVITGEVADSALNMLGIDELGLDDDDRRILSAIVDKFGGGPVGLDTLAASTGDEDVTIEDVVEPFLLQLGFISRTPRGRIALPAAYRHMGRPVQGQSCAPDGKQ